MVLPALSDRERINLIFSVGTHRKERPITPIAVAELIRKALARQSLEQIADDLQLKSVGMLNKFLSLNQLPAEVTPLVGWGGSKNILPFSSAVQISRLAEPNLTRRLCEAALQHKFTKDEVQAVVQRVLRSSKTTLDEAIEEILRLRPQVERQFVYMGFLDSGIVQELGDDEVRKRLRKSLAGKFGAKGLKSVSVKDGKFLFILSEGGMQRAKDPEELSPERLEAFVATLVQEVAG